ncbi:MAG: isoprenoid biosynthesis glyoxalase ElbB [Bacteroidales bacterium]|jgi:enhancing lycopene biosynthesis protein 2|nr:isoprenoid biosynthesis glyoxalase ElbB [Bacteroidales bacterium]
MKKFAVILSGSGVFDGTEIHEATLSLLAIAQAGAEYEIFAPDIPQHHVINHITGEEMNETRNVLIESARIARGKISLLSAFESSSFDAILFPGGFGVAKNLCSLAVKGPDCSVNADVEKAIKAMYNAKKPIGALCIAPALIARVIEGVKVTIGQDESTAGAIHSMGGVHISTTHGEVVEDKTKRVFTTPCYMLDASISDIYNGANNVVKAMMDNMK